MDMFKQQRRTRVHIAQMMLWMFLGGSLVWGLYGCKKARVPQMTKRFAGELQKRGEKGQRIRKRKALARQVLSKLAVAQSHHQKASILQRLGHHQRALAELDAILALTFPKSYRAGEEMQLDTWGRKAMLLLRMKQASHALKVIKTAIKKPHTTNISFYVAHLHHVKGRILEQLQRPKQALQAFQHSIDLNKAVIRQTQKILQKSQRPLRNSTPQTKTRP